jgi:hypothetical protein
MRNRFPGSYDIISFVSRFPTLDLKQGFPTLDPRIHLAPRRDFCGSAEEFQKK